jgi:hypothetical protein
MVETLADAPLRATRLPVDLFSRELTKRPIRFFGDQAPLRQDRVGPFVR